MDSDLASTALSRSVHNKNVFPFISEFWQTFQRRRINPISEKTVVSHKKHGKQFLRHSDAFMSIILKMGKITN